MARKHIPHGCNESIFTHDKLRAFFQREIFFARHILGG